MNPAFQATFADFRIVKGRKVAQLVFEVPLEAANAALETLGGVPMPDKEAWVGIARIDAKAAQAEAAPKPVKERHKFSELPYSQQAALRCRDAAFIRFVNDTTEYASTDYEVVEAVRQICRVESRSLISDSDGSGARWRRLNAEYEAWLRAAEHVEGAS